MIIYNATDDVCGTSFQGYIAITYKELVEVLGEPHHTDDDKITAEWDFKTSDGTIFTIYDYKEDATPTTIYDWHIGGHDEKAVEVVRNLFEDFDVEAR
jgi:hypothetical protein